MLGVLAVRALALLAAAVAAVLVGGMPSAATGSEAPADASPAATTDAFAALATEGDDHSPLLLRLPSAGMDPALGRATRRPEERGRRLVEQPVVPHDFALRLLEPGRMLTPRPLTRVSGPPEEEEEEGPPDEEEE